MKRNAKEVWILQGGYSAFKNAYPYLCGLQNISEMTPLPHQIEDFLFLGSRAFTISAESLQQLGILIVFRTYLLLSTFTNYSCEFYEIYRKCSLIPGLSL